MPSLLKEPPSAVRTLIGFHARVLGRGILTVALMALGAAREVLAGGLGLVEDKLQDLANFGASAR